MPLPFLCLLSLFSRCPTVAVSILSTPSKSAPKRFFYICTGDRTQSKANVSKARIGSERFNNSKLAKIAIVPVAAPIWCAFTLFCVCSLYFQAAPARLSKANSVSLSPSKTFYPDGSGVWWVIVRSKCLPKRLRIQSKRSRSNYQETSQGWLASPEMRVWKGSQVHQSENQDQGWSVSSHILRFTHKRWGNFKRESSIGGISSESRQSKESWSRYQILCGQIKVYATLGYLRRPSLKTSNLLVVRVSFSHHQCAGSNQGHHAYSLVILAMAPNAWVQHQQLQQITPQA